ncbi:hypothetical protein [Maricaulis sp.]|uniref:hypothetical protein n=1 Tax=Maricaulis sp. TaxID=1486257 RepID=UPI002B26A379|nr:hypothetical protein [Maricaulis sp.]
MPITHRFDTTTGILFSKASGDITPEDGLQSHREIADYRSRHASLKLVADMRDAAVIASPDEVLAIMQAFFHIVGPDIPVALIVPDDAADPNPLLAQTQAFIEGGRMRVFHRENAATSWLLDGAPRSRG